ncbi:MAG: hypothetical protein WBA63_14760 [Thermomicrobiales bacterium]
MVKASGAAVRARELRPLNQPAPTNVLVRGNRLVALVIDGAMIPVAEIQDRWLSQDEWWRPAPIDRLYYAVVLANGRYLVLYRDRIGDRWFTQRHET